MTGTDAGRGAEIEHHAGTLLLRLRAAHRESAAAVGMCAFSQSERRAGALRAERLPSTADIVPVSAWWRCVGTQAPVEAEGGENVCIGVFVAVARGADAAVSDPSSAAGPMGRRLDVASPPIAPAARVSVLTDLATARWPSLLPQSLPAPRSHLPDRGHPRRQAVRWRGANSARVS